MKKAKLHRVTESGSTRYYKIEIYKTLFDDFIVEREYGNILNKNATGCKKDIFTAIEDANLLFFNTLKKKQRKGYS